MNHVHVHISFELFYFITPQSCVKKNNNKKNKTLAAQFHNWYLCSYSNTPK